MRCRPRRLAGLVATFFLGLLVLLMSAPPGEEQPDHDVGQDGLRYQGVSFYNHSAEDCDRDRWLGVPEQVKKSECVHCQRWLTCKNLLYGTSEDNYKSARKWMEEHKPKAWKSDGEIHNAAKSCDAFIKHQGYQMQPGSPEEYEFPIAFNLLVHTNAEQVERLLRSIYMPQNVYCIHIDEKQPSSFKNAIRAVADCFPNVFIPSTTERIVYAGFSRLKADINCMQDLVRLPSDRWRYLLNVAGQSLPLRSNREMVRILNVYNGANDVEGMYKYKVIRSRIDNEWKEFDPLVDKSVHEAHINRTGAKNPKPPDDIDIVRGSAYGVFSRAFVEWLLTDTRAQHLLEWSKKTYSPDEHYWSTLHHTYSNPHLHPPGGYSGIPQEKPWLAVYVAWGGQAKCHGQWRRGICILGVQDLPSLLEKKEFFVNKFYMDYQFLAMQCFEKFMLYKNRCPQTFDLEYYTKLPFIKRKSRWTIM